MLLDSTDLKSRINFLTLSKLCHLGLNSPLAASIHGAELGLINFRFFEESDLYNSKIYLYHNNEHLILTCSAISSMSAVYKTLVEDPSTFSLPDGQITRIFYEAAFNLYRQVERYCLNKKVVWLTGYSLGAGVATALAYLLSADNINTNLVTFAQPKIGDAVFAESFNQKKINHLRYIYHKDLIPDLPYDNIDTMYHHTGDAIQLYDSSHTCYNPKLTRPEILVLSALNDNSMANYTNYNI